MDVAEKIQGIEYLGDVEKIAVAFELGRVIPAFESNLLEVWAHGSAVTGHHYLKGSGKTYLDLPDGFEKFFDGEKSVDADILFIVKNFQYDDPISGKGIYRPAKREVPSSEDLPWRPLADEYPRLSYSLPDKNGVRRQEEHYRFVQFFEDPHYFKIDGNVASKKQYELWENKIPEWAKIVLYENPSK